MLFRSVVDDGKIPVNQMPQLHYIKTEGKIGVGKAKNLALKSLMDNGCDYLFLLEDDVEILDEKIFSLYIEASNSTGIKHFNFGLHGDHNLNHNGQPHVRKSFNYPDGTIIDLYPNLLGALSFFTRDVIEEVGYIDESYYNALEHVDHTYQIIQKNYHPPFRWFADVHNSSQYIKDIVPDHEQSVIRSEKDFLENFKKNLDIFISKNNFSVSPNYGPSEKMASYEETVLKLKEIWKSAHQK